jgi:CheY-like chemotaxis protein
VPEDLPRALLIDRIRLRQVLVNLVGNAVKFTDKGVIEVRVEWQRNETGSHGTLLIEVQDTGVGIPEDKLDAIFKPFVQAQAHADRERAGTGLGLAIVRRLTETMGGTVTAASVMGQGSAFSLRFPDVEVSARLAPREKEEKARPIDFNQLLPATILVVDDNETNRQLMSGMFCGSHHQVTFGSSGTEAVELARTIHPDIILLDVRMPDMNGLEALEGIRKLPGKEVTPVIAVTASALGGEEEGIKSRFSGYIRKPFTKEELYDELSGFLPQQECGERAVEPGTAERADLKVIPAELVNILRGLQATEWVVLRDSVAINDCGRFAGELMGLARQWQWPPLEVYARTLAEHSGNYAVVEMEHHLLIFPGLIQKWEKGITS